MKLALGVSLTLLTAAACGAPATSPSPAVQNTGAPSATASTDPVDVVSQLAAAARADDPSQLQDVIHPTHGAMLWYQPGAHLTPLARVAPGEPNKPSAIVAGAVDGWWAEQYWPELARTLDGALARLDRDPADPTAAIYGTCEDDGAGTFRAYLVRGAELGALVEEVDAPLDPAMTRDLAHVHAWGADVYLAETDAGWRVVHVMVWTPCDA